MAIKQQTLGHILRQAIQLEREEQERFLNDSQAEDYSLRQEAARILGATVPSAYPKIFPDLPPANDAEVEITQSQPRRLGHFEVIRLLGKGGMGEVWLALDTKLNREVAIKLLQPSLTQREEDAARLRREARMLAAVTHPNIAAIHDFQEEGERLYLVMEYVPGRTLREWLRECLPALTEVQDIFRQIAAALAAAHERGIVHRDLKPENVRLTPDGLVKVLDFGLARPAQTDSAPGLGEITRGGTVTQREVVIGTPAYMSPEQIYGGKKIEYAADVWAFGCMLYEALTGTRPFLADEATNLKASILTQEPNWSALPLRTPLGLKSLLRDCLKKHADERPRDAAEVLRRLENRQEKSRRRTPDKMSSSEGKSPGNNRWWIRVLLIIIIIAVVSAVSKLPDSPKLPHQKFLAIQEFSLPGQASPEDALLGRGLAQSLGAALRNFPDVQIVWPSSGESHETSGADHRWLVRQLGATVILKGQLESLGDRKRVRYSLLDRNGIVIKSALAEGVGWGNLRNQMARQVAASLELKDHSRTILQPVENSQKYWLAISYLEKDSDDELINQAILLLESLVRDGNGTPPVQAALVQAYLFKLRSSPEPGLFNKALAAAQLALLDAALAPEVQTSLGMLYIKADRFPDAIQAFLKTIEKRPNDFHARIGLATAYTYDNQIEAAKQAYLEAIALRPGEGNLEMGAFYLERARRPEAITCWLKAAEKLPDNPNIKRNLGNAYLMTGPPGKAEQEFRKSLKLEPTPDGYNGLGAALFFQERYAEAVEEINEGLKLRGNDEMLWGSLGDVYRWLEGPRSANAHNAYNQAIVFLLALLGDGGAPIAAVDRATLADWLIKKGDRAEALLKINQAEAQLTPPDDNADFWERALEVYHLAGLRNQTLNAARKAVSKGYTLTEFLQNPELQELHNDPVFVAIFGN